MWSVRNLVCVWFFVGLMLSGCSSEKPVSQTGAPPSKTTPTTKVRKPAKLDGPTVKSENGASDRLSKPFEIPRDYQTQSLETLFSRVLSRGFRTVSKGANLSQSRCVKAMQAVVDRGQTSVSFLEAKLNNGSLSEKALAMWLVGSMGFQAKSLARDLGYGMAHSWTVPIKRCVKGGGDKAVCARKVFANQAPWSVKAGCRGLASLGSSRAVVNVAAMGLGQTMMEPCLPAYVKHLREGPVRDRLIESWSNASVRKLVGAHLENRPKAALSFAVYWLHSVASEATNQTCPLKTVLGASDGPLVKRLSGRLHAQEIGALVELRNVTKSSSIRECISTYLTSFGSYDPTLAPFKKPLPDTIPTLGELFEVGGFCPADG
jgi:hypothetical protein